MNTKHPCPCCSGKEYAQCCMRFHNGQIPENALQLMRSRYSAYALDLADYIIKTTHPNSPHYQQDHSTWKKTISEFSQHSLFNKLDVLDFKEQGATATVTFTAYLSQGNQDATFTETSYFEQMEGHWLYTFGNLAKGRAPHLIPPGPSQPIP